MIPIQDLLQYHRPTHSRVQMDNSITRKTGCTLYGMFKQALRELHERWQALRSAAIDILELEHDIAAANGVEGAEARFQQMRRRVRHEALLDGMTATARETVTFYEQACALRATLPAVLDDDTIEQLELDYWVHWTKKQIALEIEVTGSVSINTLDAIISMPEPVKYELLAFKDFPTGTADFLRHEAVTAMPPVARLGYTIHQVIEDVKNEKQLQLSP